MASPTEGLPAEIGVQFVALRQRYVAGLPLRWAEIHSAPDNETLLAALHRLSGSAASFGFEPLGRCAREAETRARQGARAGLDGALAELEAEIRRAATSSHCGHILDASSRCNTVQPMRTRTKEGSDDGTQGKN